MIRLSLEQKSSRDLPLVHWQSFIRDEPGALRSLAETLFPSFLRLSTGPKAQCLARMCCDKNEAFSLL